MNDVRGYFVGVCGRNMLCRVVNRLCRRSTEVSSAYPMSSLQCYIVAGATHIWGEHPVNGVRSASC